MGEPSFGSRWIKPSTLSFLPAKAAEGCIVRKSAMAGRLSKWGTWRFVNGTESLAGGAARAGKEGPRRTRRISRRAQECLLAGKWDTASLQECVSAKEFGHGIVGRRTRSRIS